jgi:hypothetical protein
MRRSRPEDLALTSPEVIAKVLTAVKVYNRRLIHRTEAGIPTLTPMIILEAESERTQSVRDMKTKPHYAQISHHTGAMSLAWFLQTIELTKELRQAIAVQIMYAQVPEFHA